MEAGGPNHISLGEGGGQGGRPLDGGLRQGKEPAGWLGGGQGSVGTGR